MLLFRPLEIVYRMDHGRHCAAIHVFNIRIARYFLSILHIHGEFVFIMVASFILLFPPQEIMYPGRRSATTLFFNIWTARYKVYSFYIILLYGGHRKIHNSLGEPMRWLVVDVTWCDMHHVPLCGICRCTPHFRKSKFSAKFGDFSSGYIFTTTLYQYQGNRECDSEIWTRARRYHKEEVEGIYSAGTERGKTTNVL